MQPVHFINAAYRYLHCMLLMLVLVSASADARPTAGTQVQPAPVSGIEMPVRLSLDPLAEAAEKMLPDQAGNWRDSKDWNYKFGIRVK